LENEILVYNLMNFDKTKKIETGFNQNGLISVSAEKQNCVVATLHTEDGYINVELISKEKRNIIKAHENGIRIFCLNFDGSLIATASEKVIKNH
jgi:hypothetical protein